MSEGVVIRKATLNDIDFIIETIIVAEKSGTENFGLAKSLDLSEEEMRKYLRLMIEEEIDGCEFSISSFLVADYNGTVISALAGWVEGDNEDSLPSSIVKSNLISYFVPTENILKLNSKSDAVGPIQIEREKGSYQFEYGYTHPDYRGKGIMDLIISEHMQIALKKGVKKMQVHIFENNSASLRNYRKKGFEIKNRFESKNPLTLVLFPYNIQLLLEKDI